MTQPALKRAGLCTQTGSFIVHYTNYSKEGGLGRKSGLSGKVVFQGRATVVRKF